MAIIEDQQFCLRWNNFQANFTSQFETLRDDEDFTDVTIACEGQKLQGHKVVLSACSPYFKELFKANPCSHPIIFMRDVEARHMVALMEFMYAGEVNVAQAHLSNFLKTAESLRIRGLTDTSENDSSKEENTLYLNPQSSRNSNKYPKFNKIRISSTSTVTSSQDIPIINETLPVPNTLSKRACKLDSEGFTLRPLLEDSLTVNPFAIQEEINENTLQPKIELPDYISDEEARDENGLYATALSGGIEIIPHASTLSLKEPVNDSYQSTDSRKLHSLDPRPCEECGRVYSNLSNLRQHMKLIHYPTYVRCDTCNKLFKTDLYLRRHMLSAHGHLSKNYMRPPDSLEARPKLLKTYMKTRRSSINEFRNFNVKSSTNV